MVTYKCDICDKEFNHKGNYDRHKNRKNSCKNNPLKSIKKKQIKTQKNITCNYCYKNFSRSDSLSKHVKSRCKIKKNLESNKDDIINLLLIKVTNLEKILQEKNIL